MNEQMLMGAATAALCLVGLLSEAWLLEHTAKGQRLTRAFGSAAVWVLRVALLLGLAFGVALAADWIRPVRWGP